MEIQPKNHNFQDVNNMNENDFWISHDYSQSLDMYI